jgi:ketosteroid isomerase-like protein
MGSAKERSMRSILVTIAVLMLFASCTTPREGGREESPMDETEIPARLMELENGAMERWRNGDPGGYMELASASGFSYFDPGLVSRLDGRAAFHEYLEPLRGEIRYEGSEFLNPRVQVHGDAAVLSYNYVSSGTGEDGSAWSTPWNVTEVFARSDDRWELVHSHFTVTGSEEPEDLELPVPADTPDPGDRELLDTLLARENAAMERWRNGDPQGFVEASALEVTYFDPSIEERLDGLDALEAYYAPMEGKIRYSGSLFANARVQRYGDLAVLTFNYVSSDDSGSRTVWNTTEVYAFLEGAWKIVHTHWSYVKGSRPGAE